MKITYPDYFYCPISKKIMFDPYIDKEGNSYEYHNILYWIKGCNAQGVTAMSPITRNPIHVEDLVPNDSLKKIIDEALIILESPIE